MTSIGKCVWGVALLTVGGLGISGCFVRAPLKGEVRRPRPVSSGPAVRERDLGPSPLKPAPAEEEGIEPAPSPYDKAPTPAREASNKLVIQGESFMETGEYERALYKFEEAINIDPTNGEAYFHMADVQTELGAYDEAEGLLDKAESLVGHGEPWGERIDSLRQRIRQERY